MQHLVYSERRDVEVRIDGAWWPGELRMWTQRPDESWWAQATWRREPGMTFSATVPADDVRAAETEHTGPAIG